MIEESLLAEGEAGREDRKKEKKKLIKQVNRRNFDRVLIVYVLEKDF